MLRGVGGSLEGGHRAGLGHPGRGRRWDLEAGGNKPHFQSPGAPSPRRAWPHLCGCRCASAVAPGAGGGFGKSSQRPAAPGPCGPPPGRAAARSALGAQTPPCRRPRSSPPVRAGRGCRTCRLELSLPCAAPNTSCTAILILNPHPPVAGFPPHLRSPILPAPHPHPTARPPAVFLPAPGSPCDSVSPHVPWSPLLKIPFHSALHSSLTLPRSLSGPSRPHSHSHLVHIKVVYDGIEAGVQVIEQGHHLEGKRIKRGGE